MVLEIPIIASHQIMVNAKLSYQEDSSYLLA
ncbi:MAG: hypothetical protein JWR72_3094 [Flavisolibacter sp.]|jgi:hypothetical protein|nr:hypothetical protein [Flavisolibacter sp.]